jgi:hypothetical protein
MDLRKLQDEINSRPIKDFDGLSATEIRELIYRPFSPNSVVQFQDNLSQEIISQIPILNLLRLFLDKIKSGKYTLTKNGNLSTALVKDLYSAGYISEFMIDSGITKLYKEESSFTVNLIHIIAKVCGYIVKRKDSLVLTKKVMALLDKPDDLAIDLFLNHSFKFNHGYFDLYPETQAGSTDISYIIFLINKYGDTKRPTSFYSEKLRIAFPDLLFDFEENEWASATDQFDRCIHTRVFDRFLFLYGFITGFDSVDDNRTKIEIRKSVTFNKFFKIKK